MLSQATGTWPTRASARVVGAVAAGRVVRNTQLATPAIIAVTILINRLLLVVGTRGRIRTISITIGSVIVLRR